MSVAGFFIANITGTIVRLYLIRRLGEAFEAPIDDVLGFIRDYRIAAARRLGRRCSRCVMVNELRRDEGRGRRLADAIDDEPSDGPAGQLIGARGSERCSTSSVLERPRVREGEAAPERLAVEVGAEPVAEVDRQGQPVRHDDHRAIAGRAPAASSTAAAMRSATSACGSQPSGSSPRR